MSIHYLLAGPIKIIRGDSARIDRRPRTIRLGICRHSRRFALVARHSHAALEADEERDVFAFVERNVRVDLSYFTAAATDFGALGEFVRGDIAQWCQRRCCEADKGGESDNLWVTIRLE